MVMYFSWQRRGASNQVFDTPPDSRRFHTLSFWLADAMRRVALGDSSLDGVGKNAAEKTNGTRGRSIAASDDGLSAQLLGLDRNPCFSGHDVLEDLVDVSVRQILDPPDSYEGNDVRSIRPVSVTIVDAFFCRPPFPRMRPALRSAR